MAVSVPRKDFRYYLKILTQDRKTLFFYKKIRAPLYRIFGYKTVNPYYIFWDMVPLAWMKENLDEILKALNVTGFNTIIDHACGKINHYTSLLKEYGKRVIGVDILDKKEIKDPTDYIQVPVELKESYFPDIPSESVDCVFIAGGVGMHPNSNWKSYSADTINRISRYLTAENYPRLLKKGGYIIVTEWESYPEKRFKRAGLKHIEEHITQYYPHNDIPGFEVVLQGFLKRNIGPYIVFRKK